jgi:hypothetical protein
MTYIKSEKEEFERRMGGIVRQAKRDETAAADASLTHRPMSTYSRNLDRLYTLVQEDIREGKDPENILNGRVLCNLKPPYAAATKRLVKEFKDAGATDREALETLIDVYRNS